MKRGVAILLVVCMTVAAGYLSRRFWLIRLGYALVASSAGEPGRRHADAVLLPNGDHVVNDTCTAVLEQAALLARASGAKSIFMTCSNWYGVSKCELAEAAFARQGHPTSIRAVHVEEMPDWEEVDFALRELRRMDIRSVIVVLPNYKTRRLGRLYRKAGGRTGIEVSIVPSACSEFDPKSWWTQRESQKLFAYEVLRRVAWF